MSINIAIPTPYHLLRQTCTLTTPTVTRSGDGAPSSTSSNTTTGTLPCFLDVASSNDQVIYGGETNTTVYNLYLSPTFEDGGGGVVATSITKQSTVNIDGVAYEVLGAGVDQASAGCLIVAKVWRKA